MMPTNIGTAYENQIHDVTSPINSKGDLVAALQATPLWGRMAATLQNKVLAIT
jgi:hypothetical protein